ncbi:MAG: glycosyltransferase family 2 protein [Candidatus Latescibacteria bacterium]|nr:glycosyltransferase family 2 protein [Candidatus Latescibacterota bacterium]
MRFSVIVPCYNAQRTITRCLDSLFCQTLPRSEYEVIVVDDGSTDDSLRLVGAYDCLVLGNTRNVGPGVARNLGASRARGQVLVFTDSDCIAPPDWLAAMGRHFADPAVQAVWGGYSGSVGDSPLERFALLECVHRQTALEFHLELSSTSNFACRRSAFVAVGGFPRYALWGADPEQQPFWGNEDMDIAYLLERAFPGGMRWDGANGVVHHFRASLGQYLKQQAFFASAAVVSYVKYPGLRTAGSGAGRHSVMVQQLLLLPLAGPLLAWWWPWAAVAPLLCPGLALACNPGLARLAGQRGESRWRIAVLLVARNLAWAAGITRGMWWGLGGWLGRNAETPGLEAAKT